MAPSRLDRRHALGVLVPGLPEPAGSLVHEELGALERHGFAVRLYALGAPGERVAPATAARAQAPLVQVPASLRGHGGEFAARHARLLAASPRRYLGALACAMGRGVRGL
ncbi:MAG TPA: hypothetical protein VFZ93_05855, partial [Albitalea sp.]